MANFVLGVDPDANRRAAFFRDAAGRIDPLPGLTQRSVSSGDFQALWAAGPRAPVSAAGDDRGAAVLWGSALHGDGSPVDLAGLTAAWADGDPTAAPFDGYYAAAVYRARTGLILAADLIGMFPVFWWAGDGGLLAGSSPELFRLHPAFRSCLDVEGLAAILLTSYSVGGRTLFEGVRRLAPGHVLCAPRGAKPREDEQYRLPVSDRYYDLPFSAQVELLKEVVEDSVRRHVATDRPCTLSLSGGRDSRLLAGFLANQKNAVTALTFGESGDNEMHCASAVARASGFDQRTLPLEMDPDGEYAERHAKWLHCSTDFGSLHHWGSAGRMGALPSPLVTGYVMDSIVGGSHIGWAYDKSNRRMSFDAFFSRINSYCIAEGTLRVLFRQRDARDLVENAKATIREIYHAYSDIESRRAWCFDIHHRQRLHVGNSPWLFSFATWPVQPAVDRRVLGVAGGMPAAALAERRAQDEMLRRFFPRLAALPLDRNNFDTEPLSPRLRYRMTQFIRQHTAPLQSLVPGSRNGRAERRFYHRLYDFNGRGWQAARRLAEPNREKVDSLFDRAALDAYLPPPDRALEVRDRVVDTSGRKMLVGLMLWARDNL